MFDDILNYDKYIIEIVCPHCMYVILWKIVKRDEPEILEWGGECFNCGKTLNEVLVREI